jgi:endogenous inhibitor of DNA gyrase (YacG/DUF329 family)
MLYCPTCSALAAVTEDKPKQCATCGSVVEWRESDGFTLTYMDRLFLKQIKISAS